MTWQPREHRDTCVTCGGDFDRKWHRIDAKYCSGKCRQKALRQRRAAEREARYKVERDKRVKAQERRIARLANPKKPTAKKRRARSRA